MSIIISGIQQLGVGVYDVYQAWNWYRDNFGADILLSDAPGEASLMLPYTDNKPQTRHTFLAYNMQGGGGFELWQYTSRNPKSAGFEIKVGDLGTFAGKLKCENPSAAYLKFKHDGLNLCSKFSKNLQGKDHFFVKDLYDNIYEIIQSDVKFSETDSLTGGVFGAYVGCTDMEKSIKFYGDILGYDTVVYDQEGVFDDFALLPGGTQRFRRVLLKHSKPRKGPFSNFLNESCIELVKNLDSEPNRIFDFKNHLWGDPGFIQICFDVKNMKNVKETCEQNGVSFTTDSNPEAYNGQAQIFDMGGAAGHFAYIEDPDRNLIEFVETYSIPIVEKWGLKLNLAKRNPEKPLPDFMVSALRFLRKGADYCNTPKAKSKLAIAQADKQKAESNN